MNRVLAAGVVLLFVSGARVAVAQPREPARHLPRISVEQLLKGRPEASSLDELRAILEAGHEVVVTDAAGHTRRGRVVRIDSDKLVLRGLVNSGLWEGALVLYPPADLGVSVTRALFPAREQAVTAASIARIDIVDPVRDGEARGLAVAAAFAGAVYVWERRQPDTELKGVATLMAAALGIPFSIRMGHVLDRAINRPIYVASRHKPRAELTPLVGSGLGLAIRATF